MKRLEYRMYGLVPYNLSPIQQGIQFGHAVVEYGIKEFEREPYQDWAVRDKTFIILNGGTTNDNPMNLGTLNKHYETLKSLDVRTATFKELDLGDQLTAVVFLVDERVWDEEKYPSPMVDYKSEWIGSKSIDELNIDEQEFVLLINNMGGEGIWELRQFLKQFKLA